MTDTSHEAWRDIVPSNLYRPDSDDGIRWSTDRLDHDGPDPDVEYYVAAALTTRDAPLIEPPGHSGFPAGSVAVYRSGVEQYRVYPPHVGPAPDDDGSLYAEVEEIRFTRFPGEPMFNGLWPLRGAGRWGSDELWHMARALAPLPLALVEDTELDVTGLVLTGAGTDHSWHLAAGFVALGFLPPACVRLETESRAYGIGQIGADRADAVVRAYLHGLDERATRNRVAADRALATLLEHPTP